MQPEANNQPENAADDANVEGDVNSDTTGLEATRRQRATMAEEPIASEGWAEADFTGFIDIYQRLRQPDEKLLQDGLRLLTADGFSPFNYRDNDGAPVGYHVELARAFCEQLNIACSMKIVPFDQIPELIANGEADAALAGLVRNPDFRGKLAFSNIFLKRPGRFLKMKDAALKLDKKSMEGKPVAVIGGTAHEAFLRAYFDHLNRVPVNDLHAARDLLQEGKVVAIFGDAFQLLPFATERNGVFAFAGKPYYDDHFFGDGMSFAFTAGKEGVGNLLNVGLQKLAKSGRMSELYARHFALDVYADYQ
nr:transporter substrate-binding domain-containing protein [uncultured Cohaesibacter sp.]